MSLKGKEHQHEILPKESPGNNEKKLTNGIVFVLRNGEKHSFPYSQTIGCCLKANPEHESNKNVPSQCLVLEYANYRVIALGERLDEVLDRINEGTLSHLAAMDVWYTNLNRNQPFVTEIHIQKSEA
jgi:hypothetical protein